MLERKVLKYYFLQAAAVQDAVYDLNWYDERSIEFKKMIIFLIRRSQKPLTLSGGGLVDLNIQTLTSVSTAYGKMLFIMHSSNQYRLIFLLANIIIILFLTFLSSIGQN